MQHRLPPGRNGAALFPVRRRHPISRELAHYYTSHIKPGDDSTGTELSQKLAPLLIKWSPARFHPGWRWHVDCDCWDRKIAKLLSAKIDSFVAFGGQALHSFKAARKRGAKRLELIAANTHVNNCFRLHEAATKLHPFEKPWLSDTHRRKTVAEYEQADIIWIASEYAREVFTREGVNPAKLHRIHYDTDPRYTPRPLLKSDGIFRIIYIGALTVCKGIPLLIDAFSQFKDGPAELMLIGGSSSRGMRQYLERAVQADPRIKIAPGDPLPHMQTADVLRSPQLGRQPRLRRPRSRSRRRADSRHRRHRHERIHP